MIIYLKSFVVERFCSKYHSFLCTVWIRREACKRMTTLVELCRNAALFPLIEAASGQVPTGRITMWSHISAGFQRNICFPSDIQLISYCEWAVRVYINFSSDGIRKLTKPWNRCVEVEGDYVERYYSFRFCIFTIDIFLKCRYFLTYPRITFSPHTSHFFWQVHQQMSSGLWLSVVLW
jgi:hypothetical protein